MFYLPWYAWKKKQLALHKEPPALTGQKIDFKYRSKLMEDGIGHPNLREPYCQPGANLAH